MDIVAVIAVCAFALSVVASIAAVKALRIVEQVADTQEILIVKLSDIKLHLGMEERKLEWPIDD